MLNERLKFEMFELNSSEEGNCSKNSGSSLGHEESLSSCINWVNLLLDSGWVNDEVFGHSWVGKCGDDVIVELSLACILLSEPHVVGSTFVRVCLDQVWHAGSS